MTLGEQYLNRWPKDPLPADIPDWEEKLRTCLEQGKSASQMGYVKIPEGMLHCLDPETGEVIDED